MKRETKAISTLATVLLILIFTIVGAFISYMWVMASFYNMPEDTTLLIFEDLVFPTDNFTYFNVTVLNPSNSVSDINITAFQMNIVSRNETQIVETAEPEFPFVIQKGTSQKFKCLTNWSSFAGELVTVEALGANASTKSNPVFTTMARLLIFNFNASENIQYFNLTVENSPESVVNLTISQITINQFATKTTPVNATLAPGKTQVFQCDFTWATLIGENATIEVKTAEGYEQTYLTSEIQGAFLYASEVKFDYTNTTYFNLTLTSLEQSKATARITSVNLTLPDKTEIMLDTSPPLNITPVPLPPNQSLTLKCFWDWTSHRNETITVEAYTQQGFTVQSKSVTTPAAVVWSIDSVGFDITDVEEFSVNITNTAISLQTISITKIEINQNLTATNSTLISPGTQSTVICEFNWSSMVGKNVTIAVTALYDSNETVALYNMRLPYLKLVNASFSNFDLGNPYFNVTIINSQYSNVNATALQILVNTVNGTSPIDGTIMNPKIGPSGYSIAAGTETVFTCPWDWTSYVGQDVTVVVRTSDGLQTTLTLRVP